MIEDRRIDGGDPPHTSRAPTLPILLASAFLVACSSEKPTDTAWTSVRLHAEPSWTPKASPSSCPALRSGAGSSTRTTGVDYPAHGRLHVLGEAHGLQAEVDAALQVVGPNEKGDPEWLDALAAELSASTDATAVEALLADFALYPPIVDDSDLPMRRVLEDRFGVEGRDGVLDAFQGGWITEDDVRWIADQGFNVVRVPMGWRALSSQSDFEPPSDLVWNEAAFSRLDELLRWCADAGIWAVLDIQEAPGEQNEYNGETSTLYQDPAMQDLTVALWEDLSRRYQDHDEVAAYSLLAEPMSAPSADERDALYDRIVKAIRAVGDDHLLVIHNGFRGMPTLPDPAALGWEGVVYSTHLFEWSAQSEEEYEGLASCYATLFASTQEEQGVPYYIGSFSTFVDADWAYRGAAHLVEMFEDNAWSWTVWTYKRIDDPIDAALWGTSTSWGLRGRLASDLDRPDLYLDDEETLLRKMAAYETVTLDPNADLVEALFPVDGR